MRSGSFHPTKETLISTVVKLLSDNPPDEISSDEVLEISGISKGSMYHHFEDFADLIEHAQVARFAGFVNQSIDSLNQLLLHSSDREEMLRGIKEVTRVTQSDLLKTQRLDRVTALAKAGHSQRMKENLAIEEDRLTEALADLFREVVNRGWGNAALDPISVAVLIQAYTMGKIVNDFAEHPMEPDRWLYLIDSLLEDLIFKVN